MSGRTDLKNWQASVAEANRVMIRPRYMMVPLPEFMQADAKNAFVKNHQMPPYEKADWKKLPAEEQWAKYASGFEESHALLGDLNAALEELEKLVHCPQCVTEGGVSLDDIDLFSRLRSITLAKGVKWPKKLGEYMQHFSTAGDVPLYDALAV
jgi:glutaredoxin 2